jgi:hypothetical protein
MVVPRREQWRKQNRNETRHHEDEHGQLDEREPRTFRSFTSGSLRWGPEHGRCHEPGRTPITRNSAKHSCPACVAALERVWPRVNFTQKRE